MKRKLSYLLFFLSAVFAIYSCNKNEAVTSKDKLNRQGNNIIPVEIQTVHKTLWTEYVSAYGNIKEKDKVDIFSKMPGKLIKLLVKEGQLVRNGDLVAMVDRDEVGATYKSVEVRAATPGKVEVIHLKEGSQVSPMAPILSISKQEDLKLIVELFETDLAKIRQGQNVIIILDALPNREFTGKVSLIKSNLDSRSGKGEIEITFGKNFSEIRPGMFARTKIIVGKKNALTIPPEAQKKIEGKQAVYTVKDGAAKLVFVNIGAQKVDAIEIVKGLKSGDTVVTFASDELKDGSRVKIVGEKNYDDN